MNIKREGARQIINQILIGFAVVVFLVALALGAMCYMLNQIE